MELIDLFWRFIGYSFLGWLMETTIFTVEERRWVNRGFLNGPVCPIYGSGALLILLILKPLSADWPLLLAAGIALTTTLEYLTSWVMEKLFHARWWDYSNLPFNLHGRITLFHSLTWGAFCLLLVYGLDPLAGRLLAAIPEQLRLIGAAIAMIVLLIDLTVTVIGAVDLNRQLARLHEMVRLIRQKNSELSENMQQRLAYLAGSFRELRRQAGRISAVQRRLLDAFPRLQSIHYPETLTKLRRWLKRSRMPRIWPLADITLLNNQTSLLRRRLADAGKPAPARPRQKPGQSQNPEQPGRDRTGPQL